MSSYVASVRQLFGNADTEGTRIKCVLTGTMQKISRREIGSLIRILRGKITQERV